MVARRKRKVKGARRVSRVKVKRARRTRRVVKKARDDLQWRMANSLLILVIGLLFLGYGAAQMGYTNVTGYQVMPGEGCLGLPPEPSAWGDCVEGIQTRVVYTCDEATGDWVADVETRECKEPFEEFEELPVAYMLVGVVLIALAAVSLLLYKKKYPKTAPAEGPAKW